MKERAPIPETDPYWMHDEALGDVTFHRETYLLRLRLHESRELYRRDPYELFPICERSGERVYYRAKPYITPPEMDLTVGLAPFPGLDGSIGDVLLSEWVGVRQQDVGQAQARYYPRERSAVLWEAFLEDRYRSGEDPSEDEGHKTLWRGVKGLLLQKHPDLRRIYTTWEDLYERPDWRHFLERRFDIVSLTNAEQYFALEAGEQPGTPEAHARRTGSRA